MHFSFFFSPPPKKREKKDNVSKHIQVCEEVFFFFEKKERVYYIYTCFVSYLYTHRLHRRQYKKEMWEEYPEKGAGNLATLGNSKEWSKIWIDRLIQNIVPLHSIWFERGDTRNWKAFTSFS